MGSNDNLPIRVLIQPRDKNLLVRLPRGTSDKDFRLGCVRGWLLTETLHNRQLLRSCLNLQDAVETSIAYYLNILDAYLGQQFFTHLILYIETGKAFQHMTILTTIPAEEYLSWTENTADTIDRNATMTQNMQIVIPELVLDEECHDRTHCT